MRKTWKIAVAITIALGLRAATSQAQPLITGNTASFGCGPIVTSDFSLGTVTNQFFPDGAGGSACNTAPINFHNGRGLAIGDPYLFYTELDEIAGPVHGFGPSEFIHVANYNAGAGSGDIKLFPNPRPGSGIQDLTVANSQLYVLTGYDTQVPRVFVLSPFDGSLIRGPIEVPRVGFTDDSVDGFAVLPNGNFLMNNMGNSCIYAEYDKTDGHFIGNIINVPGGPARCTGVDTDGTSLLFMTDFTGITRTDLAGNMTGFNFFDGPGGEDFIEDISLVHPITIITAVGTGDFFFSLKTTDDINTDFDLRAELLKNGSVIGTGLTRCYPSAGTTPPPIPRNIPGRDVPISISLPSGVALASGDVLAVRLSTRIGTNFDDTMCHPPSGAHSNAVGLRFFYDSGPDASQLPLTIAPNPSQPYYLHSDGTTCTNSLGESSGVTSRTLSTVAPVAGVPRCSEVGSLDFNKPTAGANAWAVFNTWSLAPIP